MAFRDEDIPAVLPTAAEPGFTGQDPGSMEQLFNPNRTDPPQGTPPGGRMIADASGSVPLPSGKPPLPEQAPGQQMQGLTNPDDTRYKDPQNLIMGDAMMGGMLPWAQAAADVASGRVPQERFDEVRMEHERRLEELKDQHPDFAEAANKAVPFITGLAAGITKPASTVAGTMGRGAAVTAPQGAARGFSSGPVEEPSASTDRAARAVGGAATDAAIGAGGAAVPSLVKGAKDLVNKGTSIVARRAQRRADEAASAKLDAEAKAASDAVATKKAGTAAKAAETRRLKGLDKEFAARQKAENDGIVTQYKALHEQPKAPSTYWEENRKHFIADPQGNFNKAAEAGIGLEGWSRALNLPQTVILSRLAGKQIKWSGEAAEKLIREMDAADEIGQQFKKRGLSSGVSGSTGSAGSTGSTGRSSAAPAGKPAAKPASRKPTSTSRSSGGSRSGWTPADIKPEPAPKPKRPKR